MNRAIPDPARWRRRGPPGLSLWDPRSFAEEDIRALWRFRLRHVDLKPTTDPELDYAAFADFVRRADDAWVWLHAGQIAGTMFHRHEQRAIAGRPHSVTFSEYGYAAIRGSPCLIIGPASAYVGRVLRAPHRYAYFCGFAYPHGYLPYATKVADVWLLGQEDMPERERALAEELARAFGGARWDAARLRYSFATLHREGRPRTRTGRHREALARYERLNPVWSEGVGLFLLGRINLGSVPRFAAAALRRALRRRRARPG